MRRVLPPALLAVVAALAISISLPDTAHAAARPRRLSVLPFTGKGGADVQKAVSRALAARRFKLVPLSEFRAAAGRLPENVRGAEVLRAVSAELGLSAIVLGKVTTTRKQTVALVTVRDGRDGEVLEEVRFAASSKRGLLRALRTQVWARLGPTFQRLPAPRRAAPAPTEEDPFATLGATPKEEPAPAPPPPAAAEPEPQADAQPEPAPEPDPEPAPVVRRRRRPVETEEPDERSDEARRYGPTRFAVSIGPRALYRRFTYASDPDDALSEFQTARPAPALNVTVTGFLRLAAPRIGATVSAEQAAPMAVTTSSDLGYRTFSGDYFGALLLGIPGRWVTVDLALGGGRQRFALLPEGDATSRPRPVPNVTYDYLRAGLELHVYTAGPFSFFASGHYRHVLAAGAIRSMDWFPSAQLYGIEGGLGAAYRLASWLEARLHGDLRLYQLQMSPDAGDPHVTDGAMDQYWSGSLSLAVLFGGDGR